jgi:hypothetical protein
MILIYCYLFKQIISCTLILIELIHFRTVTYIQGCPEGGVGGCWGGVAPPLEKKFRKKSQRGDQGKIFGLNSETFLKNVSFGPPFEISIEFRQKSFKNYDFY